MSVGSSLLQAVAEDLVDVPAGGIVLRDEGSGSSWSVELGAFRLAPCPVTHELYLAVAGGGPESPSRSRTPATEVCWIDAVRFCNLLSRAIGLDPCYSIGTDPDAQDVVCHWEADGFRLPSEAEWEYACRAGTPGPRYGPLDEIGWYRGNSGGEVHPVSTRAPNPWGLFDTIGNVWEWCWDVFDPGVYGPYRVFRGGGWQDEARACRASCRRKSHPAFRIDDLGFRLARSR
jgi:formylglycine-generating enzyme required for sulfatase activity